MIQTGIKDGFISMGHGRALINIDDLTIQLDIYEQILSKKLSVRATEKLVQDLKKDSSKETQSNTETDTESYQEGKRHFSEYFGAKIDIKVSKSGRGKITIPFSSEEDFNRLKKLIQSAK